VIEGTHSARFDLLIIGGGIIGLGAARDAALRGLRVALLEKEDYGWGTSNRSTRLAHGGLRYLEQYDFALVRLDLHERELLFRNAPHLVKPLPFLVPIYDKGMLYRSRLRAGMILYDVLSYDKSLPKHRHLNPQETLALEPGLRAEGLQGGYRYYDGQITFTERLNVENAIAAREAGATLLNHTRVTGLLRQDRAVCGVTAEDTLTGQRHELYGRLVINAAGPWLDEIAAMAGRQATLSRRTKGVHLVVPKVGDTAVLLYAASDGRVIFVVPWNGCSLVGTTDTDYHGDLNHVVAEPEDVAYLLSEVRRAYPRAAWDPVYFSWAGVRSLMHIEGVPESDVTRKHLLYDHGKTDGIPGLLSIIGGKLTAYRHVAEDLVDAACKLLQHPGKSRTAHMPLPGAMPGSLEKYVSRHADPEARRFGIQPALVEHLIQIYGVRYGGVLEYLASDLRLLAQVSTDHPDIMAQVLHAVECEGAQTLADVLLRRLTVGLSAGRGRDGAEAVAALMAQLLHWDEARTHAELAALDEQLALGAAPCGQQVGDSL